MLKEEIITHLGLAAATVMPLFNIPLILKIISRKSSKDISVVWVTGVWICIIFMAPSGLISQDIVWRTFNIMNIVLFTCVFAVTWKYRKGK